MIKKKKELEIDMSYSFPTEAEHKEIYKKLAGKTWKCSECMNDINRDTMNPFLLSICNECQDSITGGIFKENPYELTEDERYSLTEIRAYLEDAIKYIDPILEDKNPFEDDTEFRNIIMDFTNLDTFGQNEEFVSHVRKIKNKIDALEDQR